VVEQAVTAAVHGYLVEAGLALVIGAAASVVSVQDVSKTLGRATPL
jgi:hypothetical protein